MYAVEIQASLHFDDGRFLRLLPIQSDVLHGKLGDPGVNASREAFGLSVRGLEFKRLLAIEREDFRRRNTVSTREDDELSILVVVLGRLLPVNLDRVRRYVMHLEIAHAECRR